MKELLLALSAACLAIAQEKVDDVNAAKMRSEELEHSQIMHSLHMLTDRYGPRVTGTPNYEMAAKRAASQLREF
jgi:carboxypeptidase Q